MTESNQERRTLKRLSNAQMEAVVELGRVELPLSEVKNLRVGDVLLDSNHIEDVDLRINDVLFATGEIIHIYCSRNFRLDKLVELEKGA